jgi:hypothetical protein
LEPKREEPLLLMITDRPDPDRSLAEADQSPASADPRPEDWERLRLRFELELFGSQHAGAALDPLLRRPRIRNGEAETG